MFFPDKSISLPAPETDCPGQFDQWEEYKDACTSRAKLYSKVRGAEACKTACVKEIAGCVAVEYHVSGYCWYHDEYIDFSINQQTRKGYVLYVRIGGCVRVKSFQQSNSILHLQLDLLG